MKKRFIFFIFLLGFLLVPHETFAKTDAITGGDIYWKSGSGNVGSASFAGWDNEIMRGFNTNYQINGWAYDSNYGNNIWRSVKQITFYPTYSFVQGRAYTLKVFFRFNNDIKPNYPDWRVGHDDYCVGLNNAFQCNVTWEFDLNDTANTYSYATAIVSFVSPSQGTGQFRLGYPDTSGVVFGNFTPYNANILVYGMNISYSDGSSTDITPVVQEQQKTNQNLNDIKNKIDSTNDKLDDTNDKLDSLGDDLVDDTPPSSTDYDNFIDDLPVVSFGPISGALQMPIKILNHMVTKVNSSCTAINFGPLLGTDLIIPCFDPYDYLDASTNYGDLYTFIGAVFAIFIYYQTAMIVVNHWDKWTSFDDGFNSLYQPKHADNGYKPKHGGGD